MRASAEAVRCVHELRAWRRAARRAGADARGGWQGYVEAVHAMFPCLDCLDVVIVDGRARADCAIEALPYLRPDRCVREEHHLVLGTTEVETPQPRRSGLRPHGVVVL